MHVVGTRLARSGGIEVYPRSGRPGPETGAADSSHDGPANLLCAVHALTQRNRRPGRVEVCPRRCRSAPQAGAIDAAHIRLARLLAAMHRVDIGPAPDRI